MTERTSGQDSGGQRGAEFVDIGFVQTRPVWGELERNLAGAAKLLDEAPRFDVLVLPELFSTGYVFRDRAELERFAEPRGGPTVSWLQEQAKARGGWLVGGFPEREGDRVYNAAALAGPAGEAFFYRKIHLFHRELLMFDPGDRPHEVWEIETKAGSVRVGLMICFDWVYPESARCLAVAGAELLLHPSNLVLPYCQESMKTRCLENRVFAVTTNRTGEDLRGDLRVRFTGLSQITDPKGAVLARCGEEGECVAVARAELALARDKWMTEHNELMAGRRPEMYATLVEGGGEASGPRRPA